MADQRGLQAPDLLIASLRSRFLIGKNRTAKSAPEKIAWSRLWESPNLALCSGLWRVSGA